MYYALYYQDDKGPITKYSFNGNDVLGRPECELLPNSIILDGGWKEEIIYCVLSSTPITKFSESPDDNAIVQQFHLLAP
jgi:hypothetical protein